MTSGSTIARKEVSEWLKRQADDADGVGRVDIDCVREDERRMVLKAARGEAFSITYQTDYPNSVDEHLFVETESQVGDFVAAINDLRDFVYSQPASLRISVLLDQFKRYLLKKSARKLRTVAASPGNNSLERSRSNGGGVDGVGHGDGTACADGEGEDGDDSESGGKDSEEAFGDDEDGNDSDYVYEDDEDESSAGHGGGDGQQSGSTWLDEHYKKRTWQDKERVLREEMAARKALKSKEDAKTDKNAKHSTNKVENIFTSKASSGVLTRDLLDIQRLEQQLGMEVEAVDDNIFHWKVKINRISESSPLYKDLRQLRSRFAYGYVEMELTFTMDLYPFYPPLVKLIRPRFQGFMMGRITSLDILQLSKWSSVRGMKAVLLGVRTALETWGRLDLDSDLNDMIIHPEGSYTELEHLLMRLGLVTEMRPLNAQEYDESALWATTGRDKEADGNAPRESGQGRAAGSSSSVERKRKRPAGVGGAEGLGKSSSGSSPLRGTEGDDDYDGNGHGGGHDGGVGNDRGGGTENTPATSSEGCGSCVAGGDSGAGAEVGGSWLGRAVSEAGCTGTPVPQSGCQAKKGNAAFLLGAGSGNTLGGGTGSQSDASVVLGNPLGMVTLPSSSPSWGHGAGGAVNKAAAYDPVVESFLGVGMESFYANNSGGGGGGGGSSSSSSNSSGSQGVALVGAVHRPASAKNANKQYWAAGTGYGYSGIAGEKWDVEAYLAAQREQDRLKEDLLQEMAYVMRPDERHTYPESPNYCPPGSSNLAGACNYLASNGLDGARRGGHGGDGEAPGGGVKAKGKAKDTAAAGGTVAEAGAGVDREFPGFVAGTSRRRKRLALSQEQYRVKSINESLRILRESCLVPFLQQLLENDSLLDVDRHASLYRAVFKLLMCITTWRSLHPLLCPLEGQAPGKSLYRLLSRLGDRTKVYRSTTLKSAAGKNKPGGNGAAGSLQASDKRHQQLAWRPNSNADDKEWEMEQELVRDDQTSLTGVLLEVVEAVEKVVDASTVEELERASITRPMGNPGSGIESGGGPSMGGGARGRGRDHRGAKAAGVGQDSGKQRGRLGPGIVETEQDSARYREWMRPLQYVELEDLVGFSYKSESVVSSFRNNPQRVKRLGQEHADLSQSLPLSLSSSVFVRTHEDQMDWMQVMISGPDDTPYSGGLFVFDIFFPSSYPASPPKVRLMTTGGGQHRFNPNLYAEGKVCLSLLGTWDGDRGESWNASTSTLLQVLVSIQSLILVPEPWFNEPGFERQLGTEAGREQSWEYNSKQREATIRLAMLDMIQRPPPGFESVVKAHFYLRRRYLEHLVNRYVKEAKEKLGARSMDGSNHHTRMEKLASQLKEALGKLPTVPPSL